MKKVFLLIGCLSLSSCFYSNGCFYTPQMVNCYTKRTQFPLIAGYQKVDTLGVTNVEQRWKDIVSCGGVYKDENLSHYPKHYKINGKKYASLDDCMKFKGYIFLSPAECGFQEESRNKCNF